MYFPGAPPFKAIMLNIWNPITVNRFCFLGYYFPLTKGASQTNEPLRIRHGACGLRATDGGRARFWQMFPNKHFTEARTARFQTSSLLLLYNAFKCITENHFVTAKNITQLSIVTYLITYKIMLLTGFI